MSSNSCALVPKVFRSSYEIDSRRPCSLVLTEKIVLQMPYTFVGVNILVLARLSSDEHVKYTGSSTVHEVPW